MNKYLYVLISLTLFVSCNKKAKEQPKSMAQLCSELYPCPIPKDSVKIDTVTIESQPQYITKTEKVIVKGDTIEVTKTDTLYRLPIERIITKTVIRTVKDSALMQVYKDNIFALERRILQDSKEIGDLKLTVNKIKGNRAAWIVSSIAGWLIILLFIAFAYFVNKKMKKIF